MRVLPSAWLSCLPLLAGVGCRGLVLHSGYVVVIFRNVDRVVFDQVISKG